MSSTRQPTTPIDGAARHTPEHVTQWRDQGFAIIPDFFSAAEIAPIRADYTRIYGLKGAGEGTALFNGAEKQDVIQRRLQFKNIHTFPYDGGDEMNLISLHPALIAFAQDLLGVPRVHLYQSHTWAKYTGETDYEQQLHCDFSNHTLAVPADDETLRTVDFILYFTDVTDALGALHYVTKPDAAEVLSPGAVTLPADQQQALRARERSAAAPAGTLVAHSIDTFHRGTNLTEPDGYRFTMTVGFKAHGNDLIGFHVWQHKVDLNWAGVFKLASADQLGCLGIPLPGDAYWTPRTLELSQARWPDWDMREYLAAAS